MQGFITLCSLFLNILKFSIIKSWKKKTQQKMFKNQKGTLSSTVWFLLMAKLGTEITWLVHDDAYPWQSFYTNRIDKIDLRKIQNDSVDIVQWRHKSLQFFRNCGLNDYWGKFYFILLFFSLCSIFCVYFSILYQKLNHTRILCIFVLRVIRKN